MKKAKYLITVLLLCVLLTVFVSAESVNAISTKAYNLILKDGFNTIYIEYLVDFSDFSEASEKGLLIWTEPHNEYALGFEDYKLSEESVKDGCSLFSFKELTAKQMTDDLYSVPYAKSGGKTYYGPVRKYSVLQYAYNMLGKADMHATGDADLELLLNSMLEYGGKMQKLSGYKTSRLASDEYYQIKTYFAFLPDGTTSGLYKAGTELELKANVSSSDNGTNISWTDRAGKELAKGKVENGKANYTVTVPDYNEIYRAFKTYTAMVFGDTVVDRNSMMDIFALLARADGVDFKILPMVYSLSDMKGSRYNFYNNAYTVTDNNGVLTATLKTSNSSGEKIQRYMSDPVFDIDYYFHLVNRDFGPLWMSGTANGYAGKRDDVCLLDLQTRLLAQNKNAKIVLMSPFGYEDDSPMYQSDFSKAATTSTNTGRPYGSQYLDFLARYAVPDMKLASHVKKINQVAKNHKTALDKAHSGMTSISYIGDAFVLYYKEYYDKLGENLYTSLDLPTPSHRYKTESGRIPSPAGSYLSACVLYASTFNASPCGIEYYGDISESLARTLQEVAHRSVFGKMPQHIREREVLQNMFPSAVPYDWSKWGINKTETYPAYYDELLATALAFRHHVMFTDYDQYEMSPKAYSNGGSSGGTSYTVYRRDETLPPEAATPQRLMHQDCSGFVYDVYKQAFGYTFKNSKGNSTNQTADMIMLVGMPEDVYYWEVDTPGAVSKSEARSEFIKRIQPGDVIVYRHSTYGHTMLYLGNGQFIHCTSGNRFSGGSSDYNFYWQYDIKNPHGAIYFESIDNLLYDSQSRSLFNGDTKKLLIIRPSKTKNGIKPTAQTTARLNNLNNIAVYRTTSAPIGHTVSSGDTVIYTITATNYNSTAKTVKFTEGTLPSGLSYADSSKTGNVTLTVLPGETVNYSYGLKVTAANGKTLEPTAAAGGVTLPTMPIYVAKTLSSSEQANVPNIVASLTATDDLKLAKAFCGEIGCKDFSSTSKSSLINEYFDRESGGHRRRSEDNTRNSGIYDANNRFIFKDTAAWCGAKLRAPNVFGGEAYRYSDSKNNSLRIRTLTTDAFIPGDILVTLYQSPETTSGSAVTTVPQVNYNDVRLYIYTAENEFVTVENGVKKTISGSSDCEIFMQYIHGNDLFFLLRPSMQS